MKNLFKSLLLSFFLLSYACEDKLELTPISNLSANAFFKTEADIQQAVVAAYDALQSEGQYGFNFMMFMEVRSDNASVESPTNVGGEYGAFDLFTLAPGNSRLARTWDDAYRGIQRANIVLNRINGVKMEKATRNRLSGEVLFLRALTYFNLVRLWGDVPLVTTETTDPFKAFSVGRTPVNQIYTQIIGDLTKAVSLLPASNEAGRATLGAANTLLGKVHLTLKNYPQAVAALRAVSGYNLQPKFADNFGIANENGVESIYEVQFKAGNGEGSRYPNQVAPVGSAAELLNGIGNQRGENIPTQALFDSFEPGDQRRDVSIGRFKTINFARKLIDIPLQNNDSGLNIIVFRYADVLLMMAEALNEQGYVAGGEAFNLLNQIRKRAGLAALTSTDLPNQKSFREAVWKERRHEFVSENDRWLDLVRTNRALEVLNAGNPTLNVEAHQLLYPIPLKALDAINNKDIFPQNPGY